jgi:hypothetical protein
MTLQEAMKHIVEIINVHLPEGKNRPVWQTLITKVCKIQLNFKMNYYCTGCKKVLRSWKKAKKTKIRTNCNIPGCNVKGKQYKCFITFSIMEQLLAILQGLGALFFDKI